MHAILQLHAQSASINSRQKSIARTIHNTCSISALSSGLLDIEGEPLAVDTSMGDVMKVMVFHNEPLSRFEELLSNLQGCTALLSAAEELSLFSSAEVHYTDVAAISSTLGVGGILMQ